MSITRNHSCGFGKAAAVGILYHLLLSFFLSCAVQHPVGYPSSTCYTAHPLLRAPPGCYKDILIWLKCANLYCKIHSPILKQVFTRYTIHASLKNKHCISYVQILHLLHVKYALSHRRTWRSATYLRLRIRFGRSFTVEIRHPQSGLVVHTRKPHLQGSCSA